MGSCFSAESKSPQPGSPMSPSPRVRKRKNSKNRLLSRNSSFDYQREESLHRIPERMFLNGSNEVASLFTQQGKKGPNQDAMIFWENFASRSDTLFCGVFDGHGPYGHFVAKRVRDSLPLKLSELLEDNPTNEDVLRRISLNSENINSEDTSSALADGEARISIDSDDVKKQTEIFDSLKEYILKAFKSMDRELRMQPKIDCFFSGTTAVTLLKQDQDLIIGNVGDSRAVLGTRDIDDSLVAIQLTVDLKPNLPEEAERIRRCRGRIFALREEPEVARVWLPNNNSPGLAMARAFGDFCLKDFGLIAVPDLSYRRLAEKDEFVVLATDGIWDVLSNEEVVEIVASSPARSSAARDLVESATKTWRSKFPTSKVDDCAVVCLFFDPNSNAFSADSNSKFEEEQTSIDLLHPAMEDSDQTEEETLDSSAAEGVARADTVINLPRFPPGNKSK